MEIMDVGRLNKAFNTLLLEAYWLSAKNSSLNQPISLLFVIRDGYLFTFKFYYFTVIFHAVFAIIDCKYHASVLAVTDYENSVLFNAVYGRIYIIKAQSVIFTLFFVTFAKQPDTYRIITVRRRFGNVILPL